MKLKLFINRHTTRNTVFTILFLFSLHLLFSQRSLTPIKNSLDDLEGLLGAPKNKITTATIQSESSTGIDINCEYEGFNDKKYTVKAEILNKTKLSLKEIIPVSVELNARAKSIDFNLQFKPLADQIYQSNIVKSAFLKLTILEEGTELEKLLGGGMNNKSFLFECKKEWAIKTIANNNTIVEIKLIPLPSVSYMKPN